MYCSASATLAVTSSSRITDMGTFKRHGVCLSILREPRWQGRISVRCSWAWPAPLDGARGADARRATRSIVDTMDKSWACVGSESLHYTKNRSLLNADR